MGATTTVRYAGLGTRAIAGWIDGFLVGVVPLVILRLMIQDIETLAELTTQLVVFLALIGLPSILFSGMYYVVGLARWGTTVGKAIMGLRVLDENNARLSYKHAFFREYIAKGVSAVLLGAGYWAVMRDPKKQGWHDQLTGNYISAGPGRVGQGIVVLLGLGIVMAWLCYDIFMTLVQNQSLIDTL